MSRRSDKIVKLALAKTNSSVTFSVNTDGFLSEVVSEIFNDTNFPADNPYLDLPKVHIETVGNSQIVNIEREQLFENDLTLVKNLDNTFPEQKDLRETDLSIVESANFASTEKLHLGLLEVDLGLVVSSDVAVSEQEEILKTNLDIVETDIASTEQLGLGLFLVVNPDVAVSEQEEVPKTDLDTVESADVTAPEQENPVLTEVSENGPVDFDVQITNITNNVTPSRKRKKRHQVGNATWKINKSKEARKTGKEYLGKKKNDAGQYEYNTKRDARKIKVRCKCKRKENRLLQCALLTEIERQENFNEFWQLDWEGKRLFVNFLIKKTETARARGRKEDTKSRRKYSCQYYLKKDGGIIRVC
ncbi:unnamed protein product [Psylliodes chrysocephalus]|uniref:Uncharacterized protein n=1 Tax=Psylliodes chrysocephalus TaxID=3402493 RepID=A0A9P0D096_9CUCU|nr:unnamed protein product [Psylliodes chrysocephala]